MGFEPAIAQDREMLEEAWCSVREAQEAVRGLNETMKEAGAKLGNLSFEIVPNAPKKKVGARGRKA